MSDITVNRNRMVRLAAKLQRWRRMMLGIKGKKYHVTRYRGEMSDLCRKTLAEYQATAIRSVFFSDHSKVFYCNGGQYRSRRAAGRI